VLPTIGVPTLIIHRSGDRRADVRGARWMAEQIPGARYAELPGEDHLIWADPDPIFDLVEEFVTGVPAAEVPDRVLVTVLFTDIVESTETAAAVGDDAWRRLLDRHDEMVRRYVQRYQGREVKSTGDGFLAVFDGPARAVRCAQAIVDAVTALDLQVRAGVHTGEVERRGDDIGGVAVHVGAGRGCRERGRGAHLPHREGPRGRVGHRLHEPRHLRAQGHPGRVGAVCSLVTAVALSSPAAESGRRRC
jgi:hypothetical protein